MPEPTELTPISAPSQAREGLRLEELLVCGTLAALLLLAWLHETAVFEPIRQSRLTAMTVIVFVAMFTVELLRRRHGVRTRVIRDWLPVIGVLGVYESLKHLHANRITEWLGIAPKDALMLAADEALFGRTVPLWLDAWGWTHPSFIYVMWLFYIVVYYMGPAALLVYAYFYARNEAMFWRLRRGLVLGLLGGYVLYILVPVAGPLFTVGDQFTQPIGTQPVIGRRSFDTLRYQWDCFPSLHTAIPWLLTGLAWPFLHRALRCLCVVAVAGITLSTVALRYHYGVDVIAGVAWAALVGIVVLASQPARYRATAGSGSPAAASSGTIRDVSDMTPNASNRPAGRSIR